MGSVDLPSKKAGIDVVCVKVEKDVSDQHPFCLLLLAHSSRRSSRRDPPTSGSHLKWKHDERRRRRGEADAAAGREPAPPAAVLVRPLLPRRRKRWWWQQVAPAERSSVFSAGNRILAGLSQSGGDGMGSCFWETECFLGGVGGLLEDAEEHAQGDERGILDVRGAADAAFDFTVLQPEEEWGGSVAE
ncbi:hypothetical protein BHE74_00048665 [Ensete ventricosum]|nr:hypothetical protein BHE74_00048665 [Ensete ventricosum]